jgi:exopolysaccharide biosynthesis polyprenyl glycosylphosphotransferase
VVVPVWLAVLAARGRYRRLPERPAAGDLPELLASSALAAVGLLGVLALLGVGGASRTVVLGFAFAAAPLLLATRRAARAVGRRLGDAVRVRIVGGEAEARPLLDALSRHPAWGVRVVGRVARPGPDVADGVDEVVVVGEVAAEDLAGLATSCEEVGVALSLEARFLGTRTARAELRDLDGLSLLTLSTTPSHGAALAVKRAIDLVGAALGLALVAPLLAATALAIRLDDGGPALFVQERVGRHGRRFRLLKLRTMRVGAEAERPALEADNALVGPAFKLAVDPRVTRVGRWLRRFSVDELPQLFNVVRGEMSLVGPRPPLPDEVARYARWQRRRLSMRPGLTGLWQVSARDEADVSRWIALDLRYIDHWSLLGDLWLLLRTVPVVLVGRGAR